MISKLYTLGLLGTLMLSTHNHTHAAQARPQQPAARPTPAAAPQQPSASGLTRKAVAPQAGTLAARAATTTPAKPQQAQPAATPGSLQDIENQMNALLALMAAE